MVEDDAAFKTINLPASLHARIEKRLPKTGFTSVDDYVSFLVRELLTTIEKDEAEQAKDFSPDEEREVEDRLRNLGYID